MKSEFLHGGGIIFDGFLLLLVYLKSMRKIDDNKSEIENALDNNSSALLIIHQNLEHMFAKLKIMAKWG